VSFPLEVSSEVTSSETLRSVAQRYLAHCFAVETPPQANELAAQLGVPPYRLTRMFLLELGTRPSAYLRDGQIRHAAMLLQTELPTNEVAYRSGFVTRATFFRTFRRVAQTTPALYRRACKN